MLKLIFQYVWNVLDDRFLFHTETKRSWEAHCAVKNTENIRKKRREYFRNAAKKAIKVCREFGSEQNLTSGCVFAVR